MQIGLNGQSSDQGIAMSSFFKQLCDEVGSFLITDGNVARDAS